MQILSTKFKQYGENINLHHYDNSDHISRKITNGRTFYEGGMLRYIYENIPRKGTYIDAGANIGNHTVFFGKFCAEKQYAIEPVPENLKVLRKNVENNFLTNTTILPNGVGKISNERQIVRFDTNMGSCMLEENPNPQQLIEKKKKIITGDSVIVRTPADLGLSQIKDLTLIKIDCEIMSIEILESFITLIEINKPHIFIEATKEEVKLIEKMIGYKAVRQFNATPTFHFKPL